MKTFKVIAFLLSYPQKTPLDAFYQILLEEKHLNALLPLLDYKKNTPLLKQQETYCRLFDQDKNAALYFFEHVHGDSKERGQALVDLANLYRDEGFEIKSNELPDHIPIFCEFLSYLPLAYAKALLTDFVDIFAKLSKVLHEYDTPYASIFTLLLSLSKKKPSFNPLENLSKKSLQFIDHEALDKDYKENPVTFGCEGAIT